MRIKKKNFLISNLSINYICKLHFCYFQDYIMSFYFRQRWIDPRLQFNFTDVDVLEMDKSVTDDIWLPDVYIINEKRAAFHDITVPNRLLNIYPNGEVFYSVRITGTFSCNMNLRKYPLDRQICDIRFESYGYSASTIIIRWKESAAKLSPNLVLPQFDLIKQEPFNCDGVYFGVNYTCVGLRFYLERSKGYYITQVYVPSVLIIILSWMNFWVSVDAVPARVSLGLLTVLTMTTQTSTALANLQRVGYIKALDVWLAVCLLFVFAALIEFAFVNVATRVEQRRRKSSPTISELVKSTTSSNNNEEENDSQDSKGINAQQRKEKARKIDKLSRVLFPSDKKDEIWHKFISSIVENIHKDEYQQGYTSSDKEKARRVDKISRILFPAMFLLFNVVYWTLYLVWEPVQDL
ncbi:hypothetical protein FSP39_001995 [Pinctada imbricata]|uniref:Uncharacterized protein n=1 Tax=Pinctada imbricata TaxID=66713 RepID=A0AA89C6E0_PINIB|nr:hypothetical protein FSP39_001995 [Pinctada imbricata]